MQESDFTITEINNKEGLHRVYTLMQSLLKLHHFKTGGAYDAGVAS